MVAALWNYHLNRKRDAALRAEEALSVAAALYGEIISLRREAAKAASYTAERAIAIGTRRYAPTFDKHFLEEHPLSEPVFYKALASKIGLLSSDLVVGIAEFHGNFQLLRTSLPLIVEVEGRGYSHSVATALVPARDAVKKVAPVLRRIEHMIGITTPAEEPSLGNADSIIEMELEIHEGT